MPLSAPLDDFSKDVEGALVRLSFAVARQLIRREIKTDPGQVIGAVREVRAILPQSARNVRLHLHPDDVQLVREAMPDDDADRAWRIKQDPLISRGGCRVESDTSHIDATIEARRAAILAQLLGGERAAD